MHEHDDLPGPMIAHIAGAPVEELLPFLASSGAAVAVAVNMALGSLRDRRRRRPSERTPASHDHETAGPRP
jgi:hypothetical protein